MRGFVLLVAAFSASVPNIVFAQGHRPKVRGSVHQQGTRGKTVPVNRSNAEKDYFISEIQLGKDGGPPVNAGSMSGVGGSESDDCRSTACYLRSYSGVRNEEALSGVLQIVDRDHFGDTRGTIAPL
jgi:hypothetical protein